MSFPFLGDYELLEEIARGGMGVVYRARQLSLNRQVALKVLPGGRFASQNFIKRFRREAEALASLHHPNIVAIHEVGEYEGQLYFSMDLIEGRSLADQIREDPLPVRYAAQLIQRVAEAMAFAHECHFLHRDLKPSNILLDEHGVPHITDFGLAKRSDENSDLTVTGEILGSPNYMAPEQANPALGCASPASDVYSIGAILYHLLTGRPPFMAESISQTLRLLAEGDPVPPRLLRRGLSRDLETICLKCLETDPALRYPSAKELAEELDRFQRDKPIRARPVSPVAKLGRWCRRTPGLASALGAMIILLLVVAVGSPIALFRIQREREHSETARQQEIAFRLRAEKAEQASRRQLHTALVEQAHASVHSGEVGQRLQALEAIRRAAAISNTLDLRREALAALTLPDLHFERAWPAGSEFTLRLLDPAFDRVALCRTYGPIELRDMADWRVVAELPATTNLPAYAAWWSRDGRYLAVKRDHLYDPGHGELEVWHTARQKQVMPTLTMVNQAVSVHPHLPRLIIGQSERTVTTWDLETGLRLGGVQLASTPIYLQFSPDGEQFAITAEDSGKALVSVHEAATGAIRTSHFFDAPILALAWHPSGRWLAVADEAGTVHRMDSQTGQTRAFGSHRAQAASLVFTPDGDYLFSGGWENEVFCWDTRTMQRCLTVGRHSWNGLVRRDGLKCALLTTHAIELHTFVRPDPREFLGDLGPRLRRAVFSSDGRWVAAAADQQLGVWDLTSSGPGALTDTLDSAHPSFLNNGHELFATGSSNTCAYWRVVPGTSGAASPVLQPIPVPIASNPKSFGFVSNAIARTAPAASPTLGQAEFANTQRDWTRSIQGMGGLSPDAKWFAFCQPFSPLLEVYRLPGLEHVATLQHRGNISTFTFRPTSDEVGIGSPAGLEFWSTTNWTPTRVLTNFTGVLFTPERSTCWLTTDSRNAGLYDSRTLEPLLPLPAGILPLALSPDGRLLAVSMDFRYLQVLDLAQVKRRLRELGLDWQS